MELYPYGLLGYYSCGTLSLMLLILILHTASALGARILCTILVHGSNMGNH